MRLRLHGPTFSRNTTTFRRHSISASISYIHIPQASSMLSSTASLSGNFDASRSVSRFAACATTDTSGGGALPSIKVWAPRAAMSLSSLRRAISQIAGHLALQVSHISGQSICMRTVSRCSFATLFAVAVLLGVRSFSLAVRSCQDSSNDKEFDLASHGYTVCDVLQDATSLMSFALGALLCGILMSERERFEQRRRQQCGRRGHRHYQGDYSDLRHVSNEDFGDGSGLEDEEEHDDDDAEDNFEFGGADLKVRLCSYLL